jgi:hypothetical protein
MLCCVVSLHHSLLFAGWLGSWNQCAWTNDDILISQLFFHKKSGQNKMFNFVGCSVSSEVRSAMCHVRVRSWEAVWKYATVEKANRLVQWHSLTKSFLFFVTQTKADKLNSIFCTEFSYVVSFFYHTRDLSDVQLKFEENLYLHYITESRYITQEVTVDDFLLYFVCATYLMSVKQ